MKTNRQAGFTIIELLVATAVFSVVLAILSFGVIQIGRLYYKNLNTARTQDVVRSISEDIAGSVQFSGNEVVASLDSDPPARVCIGDDRYRFELNRQVKNGNYGLLLDKVEPDTCPSIDDNPSDNKELLGENMRLLQFSVGKGELVDIKVKVAYGDDDLIEFVSPLENSRCRSGPGSAFCAVSGLDTTVKRRVQ